MAAGSAAILIGTGYWKSRRTVLLLLIIIDILAAVAATHSTRYIILIRKVNKNLKPLITLIGVGQAHRRTLHFF